MEAERCPLPANKIGDMDFERGVLLSLVFVTAMAIVAYKMGYKILAVTIALPALYWWPFALQSLYSKWNYKPDNPYLRP